MRLNSSILEAEPLALQVDIPALCRDIAWSCLVDVTPGVALWAYRSKQQRHPWGTAEWAHSTAEAHDAISGAIADHLDVETGCLPYLACIQAFQDAFANNTPMQLSRFQSLQTAVFNTLLPELVGKAFSAAAPAIDSMKQRAFNDMYCDDIKDTFVKLSKGVQGCLTDQIYRRLSKPLKLSSRFVLEEAAEVQARRAELHNKFCRLQIAQQEISNIHEAVRTETTLQNSLLGSPVSSPRAPQQLHSNDSDSHDADGVTEECFDTSSDSSADAAQPGTSNDVEVLTESRGHTG